MQTYTLKPYLCIVISRLTKRTLKEYTITAVDEYFARHLAAAKFREETSLKDGNAFLWYVDSLEIDELQ